MENVIMVLDHCSRKDPYYENSDIVLEYSNFLKGKRIAIVGPSPHLIGSKQGNYIDSFDIVVRQNLNYFTPPELIADMGTKTDIVCTSLNDIKPRGGAYLGSGKYFPIKKMAKKISWIVMAHPNMAGRIKRFKSKFCRDIIKIYVVDYEWRMKMFKKIGNHHPSTGFISICDMARRDIEELYVTGFSFFQNKGKKIKYYYDHYNHNPFWSGVKKHRKRSKKGHDKNAEFLYVKNNIWKSKNNIKFDDFLEDLFISEKKLK